MLSRRGGLFLAGLATFLYAATLWAVRTGVVPAQGLADVPCLPTKVLLFSVFVTARGLRHAWPSSDPTSRRACATPGRSSQEAADEVADLRETERGHRQQHPERPPHHGLGRAHPPRQPLRGVDPRPRHVFRPRPERARRLPLVPPRAVRGQGAGRAARRWPGWSWATTSPAAQRLDLGVSVTPLATSGRGQTGLPLRLPGPHRHQAPGGGGAHQGEAGGGGGDGGPARPRDPQPPGLHQRVGPGAAWADPTSPPRKERLLAIITRESKRLSDTLNRFLFQARPARPAPGSGGHRAPRRARR